MIISLPFYFFLTFSPHLHLYLAHSVAFTFFPFLIFVLVSYFRGTQLHVLVSTCACLTRTLAITAQQTQAILLLVDRPRFSYQKKNSKVHANKGGYIEDHEVSDL